MAIDLTTAGVSTPSRCAARRAVQADAATRVRHAPAQIIDEDGCVQVNPDLNAQPPEFESEETPAGPPHLPINDDEPEVIEAPPPARGSAPLCSDAELARRLQQEELQRERSRTPPRSRRPSIQMVAEHISDASMRLAQRARRVLPSSWLPAQRQAPANTADDEHLARQLQLEEASFLNRLQMPSVLAEEEAVPFWGPAASHAAVGSVQLAGAQHLEVQTRVAGQYLFVVESNEHLRNCAVCSHRIHRQHPRILFRPVPSRSARCVHPECVRGIPGAHRPSLPNDVFFPADLAPDVCALVREQLLRLPEEVAVPLLRPIPWPPPPRAPRANRERERLRQRLLASDRDFTPEDYELLLQLDQEEAATEGPQAEAAAVAASMIDQLPVGRVPSGTKPTQCVVCLEDMEPGQDVRSLPCMHVFHKHCIDRWLTSCGQTMRCPIDQAVVQLVQPVQARAAIEV